MRTKAFTTIVKKLKEGGRKRLDGFLPSEFSGITEQERSELISMLTLDNDFLNLRALLPEAGFAKILRSTIENQPHQSDNYVSALVLASETAAIDNAAHRLIACLHDNSGFNQGHILNHLKNIDIPSDIANAYAEALAAILNKKGLTRNLALIAIAELLRLNGIKPRSMEYIALSKLLQAKDARIRDKTLFEITRQTHNLPTLFAQYRERFEPAQKDIVHTCTRCGYVLSAQEHQPAELVFRLLFAHSNILAGLGDDTHLLDQVTCPVCGQQEACTDLVNIR